MRGKKIRRVLKIGLVFATGGICFAETEYKPERYGVILDRSPFGSDPLSTVSAPNANAQTQAQVAKLEKTYRLSFLLKSETGEIRAGFEFVPPNKPAQGQPSCGILMVGESFMGMTLKAVDLDHAEATLEHNGTPITFRLSKAPSTGKTTPKKSETPARKFGSGFRKRTPAPPPAPKLSPEEQNIRREEIRKNLQDYQMHVIREGMPPLPVPLTQEMDDQLVSEGVLPPPE